MFTFEDLVILMRVTAALESSSVDSEPTLLNFMFRYDALKHSVAIRAPHDFIMQMARSIDDDLTLGSFRTGGLHPTSSGVGLSPLTVKDLV
jgi:hypothetical protein